MTEKIFLDSNVLISLKEKESVFINKSLKILEDIIKNNQQGVINSYVINEIHYFYSKHSTKANASNVIKSLFAISNLKYEDISLNKEDIFEILKLANKHNLETFDAYHAFYCKKLGIKKIATFDEDFKKVPSLKIIGF